MRMGWIINCKRGMEEEIEGRRREGKVRVCEDLPVFLTKYVSYVHKFIE